MLKSFKESIVYIFACVYTLYNSRATLRISPKFEDKQTRYYNVTRTEPPWNGLWKWKSSEESNDILFPDDKYSFLYYSLANLSH